jgi:hypothetical protein
MADRRWGYRLSMDCPWPGGLAASQYGVCVSARRFARQKTGRSGGCTAYRRTGWKQMLVLFSCRVPWTFVQHSRKASCPSFTVIALWTGLVHAHHQIFGRRRDSEVSFHFPSRLFPFLCSSSCMPSQETEANSDDGWVFDGSE